MKVVVAGALANKPRNGGEAWVRLSWIRGFERLGCEVSFVEEIDERTCVDERGAHVAIESSVNLAYFQSVVHAAGLDDHATLLVDDERSYGATIQQVEDLADDADLLINISGNLRRSRFLKRFRRKAYVDIDPGFTQIWHVSGEAALALEQHDVHFTIGENIGTVRCSIPTGGIQWLPTRQPVVLDDWPVTPSDEDDRL